MSLPTRLSLAVCLVLAAFGGAMLGTGDLYGLVPLLVGAGLGAIVWQVAD